MGDPAKRAVGEAAAELVEGGMRVGLGSGSTTAYAIEALGRRVREEGLRIEGVPTSFAAERRARQYGIPLATLDDGGLDLALDGADEVDPALNLIKGKGAAHAREKVVAAAARRFAVLIDPSKRVPRLGTDAPLPVEVLPMAVGPVSRALERQGARPELRMADRRDGPVVTDQGLWILDAHFADGIEDAYALERALCTTPGILEHGLFLGLATEVLVGHAGGEVERIERLDASS